LCKQIRRSDSYTPILSLLSLAYKFDIAKGMNAGAQAYFTKPVDMDILKDVIEEPT